MSSPLAPLAPREYPRSFVPRDASLGSWAEAEPLFRNLLDRPLPSAAALRQWLHDLGELSDVLDEESTLRFIRTTRHTDDPAAEKEYLLFLSEVVEPSKSLYFQLSKRYLACPHRRELPPEEFGVFDRKVQNQVALFRPENMPLETKEEDLSQRYQKIAGAITVFYEGKERTLQQMARYLELPDRLKREEAWRLVQVRRMKEKDALDDLYDEMRRLRGRIADNAGFPDYRDYMFKKLERFDYNSVDCEVFHAGVERAVVPLLRTLQSRRAKRMRLPRLLPWDTQNDPDGRPPLKPFSTSLELADKTQKILGKVDRGFGEHFARMRREGLLDLDSRKGKAPGGYNTSLNEARLSFIFMNAAGLDSDVGTLLHEGGHAMHSFASREIPWAFYRAAPIEFAEVASMGMELFGEPHLSEFYPVLKDAARSRLKQLEDIVLLLPWIAQVDAFQHWVYQNPNQLREERQKVWLALGDRFGGDVDWQGLEEIRAHQWQGQLHLFQYPFYYIEYGIAQLGALQLWQNHRRDPEGTIKGYKKGLSLGGSRPLPELFMAAGIRFDFTEKMLMPLMEDLETEIDRLEKKAL